MSHDENVEPSTANLVVPVPVAALPVAPYPITDQRRPFRWRRLVLALVLLIAGGGAGLLWWMYREVPLPAGIVQGNGRIEADPIDIATKFPGRIFELRVDEGDMVSAGQIVAIMDSRDLEQSLHKSEAEVHLQQKMIVEATANLQQLQTQVTLAEQEMTRTANLLKNGWATRELYDQRHQQLAAARAAEAAGEARIQQVRHALEAAEHDVGLYQVNIADNTLVAPREGRIEYRIANVGEVLPAGGKVFTMLDIRYVYMDIYLPSLEAGKVQLGDDARIVLDAYPDRPIPAKVTFVARQAQFTPKMVETRTERDKLMFRVRVRIDEKLLRQHAAAVRSGLPGLAYVRFDPKVEWPKSLKGSDPE